MQSTFSVVCRGCKFLRPHRCVPDSVTYNNHLTMQTNDHSKSPLENDIRHLILFFITGLVLSGITAFPIEWQLRLAHQWTNGWSNELARWIALAYEGIRVTNAKYPFISYGTDWLAFAHLVIAVAFIGPLRDPVRNVWVIEFGIIACIAVFPLAFIAGAVRGIPVYWRFIDCAFGIGGGALLWLCHTKIRQLEKLTKAHI